MTTSAMLPKDDRVLRLSGPVVLDFSEDRLPILYSFLMVCMRSFGGHDCMPVYLADRIVRDVIEELIRTTHHASMTNRVFGRDYPDADDCYLVSSLLDCASGRSCFRTRSDHYAKIREIEGIKSRDGLTSSYRECVAVVSSRPSAAIDAVAHWAESLCSNPRTANRNSYERLAKVCREVAGLERVLASPEEVGTASIIAECLQDSGMAVE